MKDERPIKETDFISLAEFAIFFKKKNDLNMTDAIELKRVAFNVPKKKIREKKMVKTPLLHPSKWETIWNDYLSR